MKAALPIGFAVLGLAGFAAGAAWVSSSNTESELRERLAHNEATIETQTRKLASIQAELEGLRLLGGTRETASNAAPTHAAVSVTPESRDDFSPGVPAPAGARTAATDPVTGASLPPPQFEGWVRKVLADEKAAEEARQKAGEEQRRIERVNRRVDRATETLTLSGLQKDQFRSALLAEETGRAQIFEKYRNQGDLFAFGDSGDGQGMGDALRENRRARDESLKSILTPEQFEKWNAQDRRGSFGRGQ